MSPTGAREGRPNLFNEIQSKINQIRYSPADIARKTKTIYDTVVRDSRRMNVGNFTSIEVEDLERLYRLYDREFFGSVLNALISDVHRTELTFRLSPRMTSAGGKTTRTRRTMPGPDGMVTKTDYEIAISTLLLFQTFKDPSKPAIVCGLECQDRLDALLRIFEHEAIHLLEMLVWGDSSCSASNFQSLAYRIFGHKGVVHELITPRERAHAEFAIMVGDAVRFDHEGRTYRGIVNRITRRASVLVPSPEGIAFSDGRKYLRFYVPLESLEKVGGRR